MVEKDLKGVPNDNSRNIFLKSAAMVSNHSGVVADQGFVIFLLPIHHLSSLANLS